MFELKIKVKIDSNKQVEFEQTLQRMFDESYFKSIDFKCELVQVLRDKTNYFYTETWKSETKFNQHKNTDKFRALLGAMKVLGEIIDARIIYSNKEENLKQIIN